MELETLLARITTVMSQTPYGNTGRNLLHGYCACLTFDQVCTAIALCLREQSHVRLALRNRLMRLLGDDPTDEQRDKLASLFDATSAVWDDDKKLRSTVDALHSTLIRYLPMPIQHKVLERWVDRGTRGAMARWLNATRDVPTLFDPSIALSYWRITRDHRAARSLAFQASPEILSELVNEMVENCEEGWIISKAILRSGCRDSSVWDAVRSVHPATFLYLCAQLQRDITDHEAFELVSAFSGDDFDGDRGLAIWSVGKMGKIGVLDRIRSSASDLFEKDLADRRERYSGITVKD